MTSETQALVTAIVTFLIITTIAGLLDWRYTKKDKR